MPSHRTLAGTLLSCLTLAHSSPLGHATQRDNHKQDIQTLSNSRANAVKEAFLFAWTGYETYAFPNDELEPVNNSFSNSRNGWGASAIDALDTAIVMELPDVVTTILDHVPSIDFSHSKDDEEVSLFETTIRYIGGMIAGFDLLKGPYRHLISSSVNVQILIDQSTNLAKNLIFAFKTPTGIPANNLQLANSTFNMSEPNGLATIGSLVLEWTRLSDITGLPEFANLTQHAEQYLLDPQPASSEPWPGLLGTNVDIRTGQFLDSNGGWGGGDDSFYEYLIKMYVYDPLRFSAYKDRWILAADSSMTHLASHPSTRPDLTFLAGFNGKNLKLQSSHLAYFDGGNFILGGLVLGEQRYIDFGLSLVDSCEDTYAQTATRIGPETWKWSETVDGGKGDTFYNRAGFDIVVGTYNLRPEVLESFYYAYRATGNTKYQDWAWNAFVAVNATCRVGSGFSAISNVSRSDGGYKNNFQESYLFAEFFKYAYLIQSASARVQVMGGAIQEWVLNTEGHPFRVVGV